MRCRKSCPSTLVTCPSTGWVPSSYSNVSSSCVASNDSPWRRHWIATNMNWRRCRTTSVPSPRGWRTRCAIRSTRLATCLTPQGGGQVSLLPSAVPVILASSSSSRSNSQQVVSGATATVRCMSIAICWVAGTSSSLSSSSSSLTSLIYYIEHTRIIII